MLSIYNQLTRKKEEFKPIKEGFVGMYSCGPTVYNFAHIGNFRNYVFVDILKRYLKYKGYAVKHIMNITDIDDKTIRDSANEGMGLKEFTEKYTREFFKDIKTLNIQPADAYPKATDYIEDMVEFVRVLVKKAFAYEKLNSVYFDISAFKEYGGLSGIDLTQMKAGARVDLDEYEKEHPGDFTLLKRSKLDELKRGIYYDTEFGKVRPGWHLECSVMSMKLLGETFDIHCGGIDLIFPHHENEIAQSEAYTGKKFVNYWIHNEHLVVEGKKMSKSLGNFYTLRDILDKGYSPKAIRYLLMSTNYRQKLNFTFEGLTGAENSVQRLLEFMRNLKEIKSEKDNPDVLKLAEKAKLKFEEEMDDNLNISGALSAVFDFVKDVNKIISEGYISRKNAEESIKLMNKFDEVLGVLEVSEEEISPELRDLINEREKARKSKDYAKADSIRKELKEKGILLDDTKDGVRWKKA